jgi:hypothetical protein
MLYNRIDHIWIDGRRYSSILDIRTFRGAECDTEHCLVLAKIRDRLAVSKQTTHRFHMERQNLKKLNVVEGKEQYRVEISHRFVVLESLRDDVDINRAWKTIRVNFTY